MPLDRLEAATKVVAILRGVTPAGIERIAEALVEAGIRAIEIPLNSPEPFKSIEILAARFGALCLCGAGTVLTKADVDRTYDAGGRLVVSPNTNPEVIERTCERKMVAMPGFATASEAFTAIGAGAAHLKLFPAATYGPAHLKALKAVLPSTAAVYPVGGIASQTVAEWAAAGASGFGFGSEIFKPEFSIDEIRRRAKDILAAAASSLVK